MAEQVFSVSMLNEYADRLLKNDPRLRSIKVSGEISGLKRHSSGHLYFSLKDADALINCVMFKSYASALRFSPKDGLNVIVRGSVEVYKHDGKFQLNIVSMKDDGAGALYEKFLRTKEKLEKEGIFGNKRELPKLPRVIGVATSDSGDALNDIISVSRRRFPTMNILLAPCSVQGQNAPNEIAAAIRLLQRSKNVDVIIVGRGGGSFEDLNCFNDERVARAIFASAIPVVSAVGHENDFTIADFAADRRAATPSAAAELCCPRYDDLMNDLEALAGKAEDIASGSLLEARSLLDKLVFSAAMAGPSHSIALRKEMLCRNVEKLSSVCRMRLGNSSAALSGTTDKLSALDPNAVILRGFSVITDADGRIVDDIGRLSPGMDIGIRMNGGRAEATVNRTTEEKD